MAFQPLASFSASVHNNTGQLLHAELDEVSLNWPNGVNFQGEVEQNYTAKLDGDPGVQIDTLAGECFGKLAAIDTIMALGGFTYRVKESALELCILRPSGVL